jgi:hypothetical protein
MSNNTFEFGTPFETSCYDCDAALAVWAEKNDGEFLAAFCDQCAAERILDAECNKVISYLDHEVE